MGRNGEAVVVGIFAFALQRSERFQTKPAVFAYSLFGQVILIAFGFGQAVVSHVPLHHHAVVGTRLFRVDVVLHDVGAEEVFGRFAWGGFYLHRQLPARQRRFDGEPRCLGISCL